MSKQRQPSIKEILRNSLRLIKKVAPLGEAYVHTAIKSGLIEQSNKIDDQADYLSSLKLTAWAHQLTNEEADAFYGYVGTVVKFIAERTEDLSNKKACYAMLCKFMVEGDPDA